MGSEVRRQIRAVVAKALENEKSAPPEVVAALESVFYATAHVHPFMARLINMVMDMTEPRCSIDQASDMLAGLSLISLVAENEDHLACLIDRDLGPHNLATSCSAMLTTLLEGESVADKQKIVSQFFKAFAKNLRNTGLVMDEGGNA